MAQTTDSASLTSQGPRLERRLIAILRMCSYIGGVLFVILMLMTVVHIIGRYGFDAPILGLVELSGFMMTISIFLILAFIMAENRHVAVGTLVDRFPKRVGAFIDIVTHIFGLLCVIIAAWGAVRYGVSLIERGLSSTTIPDIPVFPFPIIVGIGWGLFSIAIVMRLFQLITREVKK